MWTPLVLVLEFKLWVVVNVNVHKLQDLFKTMRLEPFMKMWTQMVLVLEFKLQLVVMIVKHLDQDSVKLEPPDSIKLEPPHQIQNNTEMLEILVHGFVLKTMYKVLLLIMDRQSMWIQMESKLKV